jgi:hypothetical protein
VVQRSTQPGAPALADAPKLAPLLPPFAGLMSIRPQDVRGRASLGDSGTPETANSNPGHDKQHTLHC